MDKGNLPMEMTKLFVVGKEKAFELNDYVETLELSEQQKRFIRGEVTFKMGVLLGEISKKLHDQYENK